MYGGVVFIVIIPTEKFETSLKTSKFYLGDNYEVVNVEKCDKSNEKLLKSENNIGVKVSPLNKSKSVDLLNPGQTTNEQKALYKSWAGLESMLSDDDEDGKDYKDVPLEKTLQMILSREQIDNATWIRSEGDYLQVMWPLGSGGCCERMLSVLQEFGIGSRLNSAVSVIPSTLYYTELPGSPLSMKNKFDKLGDEQLPKQNDDWKKDLHQKGERSHSAWNTFVSSVRSRLTVAQVVESVRANAALTFDFLVMLLVAAIISAIALAESNNVYLVSSMLISPMMGPVMAGTFGSVVRDRKLQLTGVRNELIGLAIATAVGFCYGIIICSATDKYGINEWPSSEMVSRGEVRTLWVGCLIALLSGAAVALGILGDNVSSLVGVAISTSLMPPAVNAGLLWAMAAVYAICGEDSSKSLIRTNFYFNNEVYELASLGGISMCLTFANIVCIYLAGILVFKIKEVAPILSKDQSRRFWKHDIKVARDYNKTLEKEDAQNFRNLLDSQLKQFDQKNLLNTVKDIENFDDLADHLYQSTEIQRNLDVINVRRSQYTWSPSTFAPKRPTIKELKNLYFSLGDKKSKSQKSKKQLQFKCQVVDETSENIHTGSRSQEDRTLTCIPESRSTEALITESCSSRKSKKFVVTPATLEKTDYNLM